MFISSSNTEHINTVQTWDLLGHLGMKEEKRNSKLEPSKNDSREKMTHTQMEVLSSSLCKNVALSGMSSHKNEAWVRKSREKPVKREWGERISTLYKRMNKKKFGSPSFFRRLYSIFHSFATFWHFWDGNFQSRSGFPGLTVPSKSTWRYISSNICPSKHDNELHDHEIEDILKGKGSRKHLQWLKM